MYLWTGSRRLIALVCGSGLLVALACADSGKLSVGATPTSSSIASSNPLATPSQSPTVRPIPPRTSSFDWGRSTVGLTDVTERFTRLGMRVEVVSQTTSPIFGAQREDVLTVDGERVSVLRFSSTSQAAAVLADVAAGRNTVSFLRSPYYVQVANAIVLITTDDYDAAFRLIGGLR